MTDATEPTTPTSTTPTQPSDTDPPRRASATDKVLAGIEKVGNALPEPFTLFLLLFLITGIISTAMAWAGAEVQVPGSDDIRQIKGLFTKEGLAWFTVNIGENYVGFPPLAYVLPIILAVGIAERSGMLSALIRSLFGSANTVVLPYAVGIIGVSA